MRLTDRKTRLVFETADEIRERGKYRQVVIEAQPTHATIRLKGTHKRLLLSWAGIYQFAAKAEADRIRSEKKAARKAKRGL